MFFLFNYQMCCKSIYNKLRGSSSTYEPHWNKLCSNPKAIPLLEKHWDEIKDELDLDILCSNPKAIPLLENHWEEIQDELDFDILCSNPKAIPLLEKHWDEMQDYIDFDILCRNPNAIPLLENHWEEMLDYIDLDILCSNPNAIPLLKKHWEEIQDEIDWKILLSNPAVFTLDADDDVDATTRNKARPFRRTNGKSCFHTKVRGRMGRKRSKLRYVRYVTKGKKNETKTTIVYFS